MEQVTNNEIIEHAVAELKGRKNFVEASPGFVSGFIAGLGFMRDGYSEDDNGDAFDYLHEQWREFADENPCVGFQANFKQISATDGKVKLVFEPIKNTEKVFQEIIHMNGSAVFMSVSDPQLKFELNLDSTDAEEAEEEQLSIDGSDEESEEE